MNKVKDLALEWYREHQEEIEREKQFKGDIGAYYYCFKAGWDARGNAEPDPLDEALNSGDGTYKP